MQNGGFIGGKVADAVMPRLDISYLEKLFTNLEQTPPVVQATLAWNIEAKSLRLLLRIKTRSIEIPRTGAIKWPGQFCSRFVDCSG